MKTYCVQSDDDGQAMVVAIIEPDEFAMIPENWLVISSYAEDKQLINPTVIIRVARITQRLEEVMATGQMDAVAKYLDDNYEEIQEVPERIRRADYERASNFTASKLPSDIKAVEGALKWVSKVTGEDGEEKVGFVVDLKEFFACVPLDKEATDQFITALIHFRNRVWPTP